MYSQERLLSPQSSRRSTRSPSPGEDAKGQGRVPVNRRQWRKDLFDAPREEISVAFSQKEFNVHLNMSQEHASISAWLQEIKLSILGSSSRNGSRPRSRRAPVIYKQGWLFSTHSSTADCRKAQLPKSSVRISAP